MTINGNPDPPRDRAAHDPAPLFQGGETALHRRAVATGALPPLAKGGSRRNAATGGIEGRIRRARIVEEARSWLGTPYRHQASAKGAGADCLGLLRGVFRAVYGFEPEIPPPYGPDWNERRPCAEPLLAAARRHLVARSGEPLRAGQALIFRIVKTGPAKHCGIVSGEDRFIHAYAGRAVIESWLSRWWLERLAGAFDFPGVDDGSSLPLEKGGRRAAPGGIGGGR